MRSSTAFFDSDPPCDFLVYLERRLGRDEGATARLLGDWLATYEPKRQLSRDDSASRDPVVEQRLDAETKLMA